MKKEEKIKQKRGGSGVGDTIKRNVGSVNKNWIEKWGPRISWKIWVEIDIYSILYSKLNRLLGVMAVKPTEWIIALGGDWGV